VTNLLNRYREEIVPAMMERFGYGNRLAVPRLEKVVLNTGTGSGDDTKERLSQAHEDLALITGQKAASTRSRKAVAGFKIRAGMPVGVRVTLRGKRMFEFLERLIGVAIPRIRDFRGLAARSFDGHGDFTFGLDEQGVFPEINPDSIRVSQGMHISIVTTATTDDEGRELLRLFGMPFAAG